MLADLLYQLTPRDSASLPLEVRDYTSAVKTYASGVTAQRQTTGIDLPAGTVGLVMAAGVTLAPAAAFTNSLNSIGLLAADPSGNIRTMFANKQENAIAPVATQATYLGLYVPANCLLLPDDDIQIFIAASAALGANLDVTAYIRLLLMPRGNIGV